MGRISDMSVFLTRVLFVLVVISPLAMHTPVEAGLISALSKVAKAGKGAKISGAAVGAGLLADTLGFIKRLPPDGTIRRIAAGTDESGHLRIATANGGEWTVATPGELTAALRKAGDKADGLRTGGSARTTAIFVPDTDLYRHRHLFANLPAEIDLRLIHRDKRHYRVTSTAEAGRVRWRVQVHKNVQLTFPQPEILDEMLFRLERTINRSSIRLLRLEPGHRAQVPSVPRTFGQGLPDADAVDPGRLTTQLHSIRGQTAIITGRIEGGVLVADAGKAGVSRTPIAVLRKAAANADVNLIVLDTQSPVQAGVRGLFGSRARFPALAEAFQRGTFGDFLDALTTPDAPLLLTAQREGERHIAISSVRRNVAPPAETSLAPEVARMVVHGAHITARDREEAEEHDMRIMVWLPSWIGFALLGNAVLGIMAWGTAWSLWWSKIWKQRSRDRHRNALTWLGERITRIVVFFVLFLPIAGGPALLYDFIMILIAMIRVLMRWTIWLLLLPVRIVKRVARLFTHQPERRVP